MGNARWRLIGMDSVGGTCASPVLAVPDRFMHVVHVLEVKEYFFSYILRKPNHMLFLRYPNAKGMT